MIEFHVTENTVPDQMGRATASMPLFTHMVTQRTMGYMSVYAPEDSGFLSHSFYDVFVSSEERVIRSAAEYAEGVRGGTGVYAGKGPIVPTGKSALKFYWDKLGAMTVWKGNLSPGPARARFVSWAIANGMVPFTVWPRGQRAQDYVTPAIETTEIEADQLLNQSLKLTGAEW